ncbi:MAG: 30S ribosomal protein S19 [Candidatus Aenigmarchaeota archaeon]|nr:30S ribosomal protein S19 [Candidatus Aenigmarchaeota archaeon]
MAKFQMKGKSEEELANMEIEEFRKIIPARQRRSLKRGFTEIQKKLLAKIEADPKKFHRTKNREMIIIPQMLGIKIGVYNGNEYVTVEIKTEMLGHRLGEFAMTRKPVKHSSPGFGATKSSKFVPLK